MVEKHEVELTEKDVALQTLHSHLVQYQNAYTQAVAQYNVLQERLQQVMTQGAATLTAGTEQLSPLPSSVVDTETSQKLEDLQKNVEELNRQLSEKDGQILELREQAGKDKKSENEEGAASKTDNAKVLKVKAQLTAKVKSLEKEIEKLKKVQA